MTTNADNPENEKSIAENLPGNAMEFKTVPSFDKFATLPNDIHELAGDGQKASGNGEGDTAATEGPTSGIPTVAGSGNYQLIREVVRSPRALIYKARQLASNRLVVFKLILSEKLSSSENTKRFCADIDAAMELSHPGIVSIYETGRYDGKQFVSMEHVDGSCLSDCLKDGPLSPKQAAEIAQRIAVAIAYAHEHGVVHRNLTPANVLCGTNMVPRLIGFGQSSAVEPDRSLVSMSGICGTPGFLAPEQVRSQTGVEGPPVDVYAVGAILYFLLTARPPFQTSSPEYTLQQVLDSSPVPPTLLNPLVSAELEAVCLKCLCKEPALRYSTAHELAADLDRWSRGETVLADRVSIWQSLLGNGGTRRLFSSTILVMTLVTLVAALLLVKAAYDRAALRRDIARVLEQKTQESQLAERKLEIATRRNAELTQHAMRNLQASQQSKDKAEQARQVAELAQQEAEKARMQMEEAQEMVLKARTDLEFIETSTIVAKLETKMESVRQLAVKGEFDEALNLIDELLLINAGQLPQSMREEKKTAIESLRAEVIQQKNNSQ